MKKLAVITTHPVQYNAPLFAMLQQRGNIALKVFYTWGESVLQKKYDPGFGRIVEWDIPLLEEYEYEFLENTAKKKGSHHYKGIINPGIIQKIESWKPDTVLIYGWKFRSHLKVMRHFKNKIPVWFRGDSVLLNKKNNFKSLLRNRILKWVYQYIDIAFYTGTNNKMYFEKNGLKSSQLVPAFHAVDNTRFFNTDNRYDDGAAGLRKQLGIEKGDFVFLFAGKLTPTKDIGNLAEAFKKMNNERTHLIIVGNGPEEIKLKSLYHDVKNLHFLDFRNQAAMPAIYQACDVFVLPSIGETWGLSINEAMAAGKVIIASDKCGGAIDLIRDGINGYIFRAGDNNDLSLKMQKLLRAKENIKQMQLNSIEIIKRFTFDEFAIAIENLLQRNGEYR